MWSAAAAGEALSDSDRRALVERLVADAGQRDAFGVTAESAGEIVAERLRLLPVACRALGDAPVEAAGYAEHLAVMPSEVFGLYLPLALRLADQVDATEGRLLVAVAGVPGCGKTVFAARLARVVRAVSPSVGVVAVGLDGYHYPNAHLAATAAPATVPEPGPLKLYKGAPLTFDVARLAADLGRLRAGGALTLPAYDRTVHEPAEGRLRVSASDRLALVEGNYLLCREPGWEAVPDLFDLRVFLNLPTGANRAPLVARHVRGGRSQADAERHYERVDRANSRLAAGSVGEADLVIELSGGFRVLGIRCQRRRTAWGPPSGDLDSGAAARDPNNG